MRKHRTQDAGFEARVALDAVKGERTVSALAAEYGVHLSSRRPRPGVIASGQGPHAINPLSADFCGEHRTEPVPPTTDRLMADLDAALMQ